MALIQWKQINPQLLGNGQLTGSLQVSGSIILNGVDLTNLSSISNTSINELNSKIASINASTGSHLTDLTESHLEELKNVNASGILNGQVLVYDSSTSQYIPHTLTDGTITSISNGNGLLGGGTEGNVVLTLDTGSAHFIQGVNTQVSILSASLASELAGIVHTDITSLNTFTASADNRITTLELFSSTLDATYATDQQLRDLSSSITSYTDAKFASLVDGAPELLDTLNELAASIGDNQNISSSLVNSLADKASNTQLSDVSASLAATISSIPKGIDYISGSDTTLLSEIEVLDYDNNVATVFQNGKLKFIFGEPATPSSLNLNDSGFNTNRFNKQLDSYNINASWSNGGYTLLSASLYEGSTLLEEVTTGTSLSHSFNTSGSHTYTVNYTAVSPLDGNVYTTSRNTSENLNKSQPGTPSLSPSPTVQLGASSNQIEQGATGTIPFSSAYGSSNGWDEVSLVNSPINSEVTVTKGSNSHTISATSTYVSPPGLNDPELQTTKSTSTTYSKIRSVRYGATAATTFSQPELEDLASWDTTLGGTIGTIDKGNTNPSGDSITIVWSGDKYQYIVFDASRSNLTNITTSGFGVLGSFTITVVGDYKIYKSNTLQAGGSGSSITYTLT